MKKPKVLNFIAIVLGFLLLNGYSNIKSSSNYDADKTISNNKLVRFIPTLKSVGEHLHTVSWEIAL